MAENAETNPRERAATHAPTDTWDPALYRRFAAERRQPFDDLLSVIDPAPGGRAVDLGCGPGELTVDLHRHVGAVTTIGVDSSAAMLDQTRPHAGGGVSFELGDLASWEPVEPLDVIAANASFQWVPDHPALLVRLTDMLNPSGQLAFQVPANVDHPTHVLADTVGQRYGVPPVGSFEAVLTPERYAAILDDLGVVDLHVRLQVYVHHLPSTDAVIDWVSGTLLTEHRRQLEPDRYDAFLDEYRREVLAAVGDPSGARPYTHLFKRILVHAIRP